MTTDENNHTEELRRLMHGLQNELLAARAESEVAKAAAAEHWQNFETAIGQRNEARSEWERLQETLRVEIAARNGWWDHAIKAEAECERLRGEYQKLREEFDGALLAFAKDLKQLGEENALLRAGAREPEVETSASTGAQL